MMSEAPAASVLRFNFDPISYSHPSWWVRGGLPENVFRELVDNPESASMLSKQMLEDYQIHDRYDFDFARSFKRIALLSYKQQKKIIFRLGLVIYRERIARAVQSAEQERLFNNIDYSDYLPALRLKLEHKMVSDKHLPALPFTNRKNFRVAVYLAGFTMLANIVAQEDAGFKIRYYFTWPKPVAIKRLAARFSAFRLRQSWVKRGKSQVEKLAVLPDHALYCLQLDDSDLIDLAKKALGELLTIQ